MSGDMFSASESEIKKTINYRERCKMEWEEFRQNCPAMLHYEYCAITAGGECPGYRNMINCPFVYAREHRIPPLPGDVED